MDDKLQELQAAVNAAQLRVDHAEGHYIMVAVHELRAAEIRRDIYLSEISGKPLSVDAQRHLPWFREEVGVK